MSWAELWAWVAQMGRSRDGRRSSPDSWAGEENDPFWANARQRRAERMRR